MREFHGIACQIYQNLPDSQFVEKQFPGNGLGGLRVKSDVFFLNFMQKNCLYLI